MQRLAIVDWDVHHGNGTQAAFYDDPSVLTISLHQENNYPPGSGPLEEIGDGAGRGANLNLPLPAGSGVGAYVAAFERVVVPALKQFRPDMILVVSGFDASALDPMGRMMLTPECYAGLTEQLMAVAAELCENRLVIAHEGGYSTEFTPFCGLATIEALSGLETECRGDHAAHGRRGHGRPGPAAPSRCGGGARRGAAPRHPRSLSCSVRPGGSRRHGSGAGLSQAI